MTGTGSGAEVQCACFEHLLWHGPGLGAIREVRKKTPALSHITMPCLWAGSLGWVDLPGTG